MCAANIRAEYRLLEPGQIEVINRCQKANGDMAEAVGRVRQIGDENSPKLKVRFAPACLVRLLDLPTDTVGKGVDNIRVTALSACPA